MGTIRNKLSVIRYKLKWFLEEDSNKLILGGLALMAIGGLTMASILGTVFDFVSEAATGLSFLAGLFLGGFILAIIAAVVVYGLTSLLIHHPKLIGIIFLLAGAALIIWGIYEKNRSRQGKNTYRKSSSSSGSSLSRSSYTEHDWNDYKDLKPEFTMPLHREENTEVNDLNTIDTVFDDTREGDEVYFSEDGNGSYSLYFKKINKRYHLEKLTIESGVFVSHSPEHLKDKKLFVKEKTLSFYGGMDRYLITIGIY